MLHLEFNTLSSFIVRCIVDYYNMIIFVLLLKDCVKVEVISISFEISETRNNNAHRELSIRRDVIFLLIVLPLFIHDLC